jgi:secreted Zn-dependent insulinase-like peptidase
MQANLLAEPLLNKDALNREIQAVNSEFEGKFSSDSVRAELIEKE